MWRVFLSSDAQKFLGKQDRHLRERIEKGLAKLKCEEPFHFLERFEGQDHYKFRVGDYRALVDADFAEKILWIRVLDHRSVIYERGH